MITIGVVDDDYRYVEYISKKIAKILSDKEISIHEFTDPNLFLETFHNYKFDLLFIDYDMQINGYEIIDMMNEQLKDTVLIMITGYNHIGLAEKGYYRNIFRFIYKNERETIFQEAIMSGWKLAVKLKDTFVLLYNYRLYQFEYKSIYCVYSSGNDLYIQQENELISIRMPIKKIASDLLDREFLHANSNTFVNSKHIFSVNKKTVVMDNNSHYSLSRSGYNEIKNWYKYHE